MNWQLAKWWALVNTAGALITVVAVDAASSVYAAKLPLQVVTLVAMGLLQVVVCCPLVALNGSRKKAFHVTLGVALGAVTSLLIPILGMFVIYVIALAAVCTLFPSGIVFGTMAGISRWRFVTHPDKT